MDLQTRRISPSEWEIWKSTILDLTRQKAHSLKRVMAIMKDEHGFKASISQYEAQLRAWGVRKNLSTHEWANVFDTIDKLKSQQKETRILISGEPAGIARIQRARRTYNKEKHRKQNRTIQGRSARLRNSSIEIRGIDGNWTPYANSVNVIALAENQTCKGITLPTASAVGSASTNTSVNIEQGPDGQGYDNVDIFGSETPLNSGLSHNSGLQDFSGCIVREESWPMPFDVPQLSTSMVTFQQLPQLELPDFTDADVDFGSPSWDLINVVKSPGPLFSSIRPDSYTRLRYNLDALPCKQFIKCHGTSGNNAISRSLNFDRIQRFAIQSPVTLFHADIISFMSINDANQSEKQTLDATYLWSSLRSLLPNVDLHGCCNGGESLMTEDEMLQAKLNQILLFSTANGFAGLEEIPIQSVLKYLSRCVDIDLLLEASNSHVVKALAENLFRAAIEAKDKNALKCLLAFPSIDVNSIVCIINGQKYTPLERAAILQDLGIVQILLNAGADAKKTYDLKSLDGGILRNLVDSVERHVRVPSEVMEIGKVLLRAGAKLHLNIVERVLEAQNLTGLAYDLISNVSDSDHLELVRGGYLSLIASQLNDWQATQATKNIIMACERTKCKTCRTIYSGKLDWALIQGAKRGHLELVKLLLLHSETPHRALSAAIRSGRSEVIDAILTLNPDINAPAHSIDYEELSTTYRTLNDVTTSYAEAIEARNERLVLEMEANGALELSSEGTRFELVITAASKVGNSEYVRKFLKCCPSPKPSHMNTALLYAVQSGHEEIFQELLAAGADVNSPETGPETDPLFAAVLRRNSGMVTAILNADVDVRRGWHAHSYKGVRTSIFGEAVKWGDISIIQGLMSAFPSANISGEELSLVLEEGDMVKFEFLLGCGVTSTSTLTHCLKIGLSRGDSKLVQNLVERGADPTNPEIFAKCVEKYPAMITLLCEHIASRKSRYVAPDFGTRNLNAAIRLGTAGFAAVKLLLDTRIVDAKSFSGGSHRLGETPLGLAIKFTRKGHHNDFEVIRRLLDYGCDPNSIVTYVIHSTSNVKQTALLEAIDTGSKDLVKLLIDRGASVNREAELGLKRTPLQKAVELGSLEIVSLLLEMGADVNAKPAERGGATTFQLAAIRGNCVIATKLLDYGADIHAPPAKINGRWPLEGAAEYGRIEMIFFLWGLNKFGYKIEQCRRAMELAEENGYMACKGAIAELSQNMVVAMPALDQY